MIPQLVLLSLIVFIMAKFMPGDALTGVVDPNMDPVQIEKNEKKWAGMTHGMSSMDAG